MAAFGEREYVYPAVFEEIPLFNQLDRGNG
jgi:hypothetical protein